MVIYNLFARATTNYKARLADAQAALNLARSRGPLTTARAPIAGVIYGREVRQGSYANAGDLIANKVLEQFEKRYDITSWRDRQ